MNTSKLLLLIALSFSSLAQVWEHKGSWDDKHIENFKKWVKTVKKDVVINKESPFYGLGVDCADMVYLFEMMYSIEHKLEYKTTSPSGKKITSLTKRYNKLPEEKRIHSFLQYVFNILSSATLRDNHSYPIEISEISSGDIFHYEKQIRGMRVRHVVMITDVLPNGNFSYIDSSQATKANNIGFFKGEREIPWPLSVRTNKQFYDPPSKISGGFRRLKFSHRIDKENKTLPHFSLEQFKIPKDEFFAKVKETHQTRADTPKEIFLSVADNLCQTLKERRHIALEGFDYYKKKNKCFSFQEFDTFSTPMRDSQIISEINKLEEMKSKNSFKLPSGFCQIKVNKKRKSFKEICSKFTSNEFSSDPYQSLEARWGYEKESKHNCKKFYIPSVAKPKPALFSQAPCLSQGFGRHITPCSNKHPARI